jgi:diguanylate cyclase (GGDEF)-like protein/PAS domain S-box-containing protein
VTLRRRKALRPFSGGGRRTIAAIFITFALVAGLSIALTFSATNRSKNQATIVEVAGRQRTLAERYVKEVLLVRAGRQADPATTASVLKASAEALLNGGTAPAMNGDDDDTSLPPASGSIVRGQLEQELRLVSDLAANGQAVLPHRQVASLPAAAHEETGDLNPIERLEVLGALTSNIALNTARTLVANADKNVNDLIVMQVALGTGGLIVSLLLAWALVAATRRQTAHFRSLAESSHDLVLVLGTDGCRYVSRSVIAMVGRPESELFGHGFEQLVHEEDRSLIEAARTSGGPPELSFRMRNSAGEWRHLEARVTDLRGDRQVHGVVINARDTTDRVRLERELTAQAQRDSFGSKLADALEMADEVEDAYEVVERAMVETSEPTPMELLLSDSSRTSLARVATSPTAGAPGCPVKSPFSCVAVRRGSAVVFNSSEALNACPKLRDRPDGPCSAVCVPVSFMGRSLGVLHTTGPDGKPLGGEAVAQLTTLAAQAGARIGTVRAFEKTQLQASTDGLTGLVNRRSLEKQLRGIVKSGHPFAIALADLDHFKRLNDTHGHETGDRALRLFAQVAQGVLREDDAIARWGGEEFMLLLPRLDRFQAVPILDRIRESLAKAHPGETPRFTASFGVSDSTQGKSIEQLISTADGGLYMAKQAGRDRVTIGDPSADLPPSSEVGDDGHAVERSRRARPSIHEAADEEDPHPSGLEIR